MESKMPINEFTQRSISAARKLQMARALQQQIQDSRPNPNQMVGNQVVPINPLGIALNTFTGGLANAQAASAENEQAKIEDERRNGLVQALKGGGKLTPEILANNGASNDELLKFALDQDRDNTAKSGTPGMGFIPPGATPFKDEQTGFVGYKLPDGSMIPSRFAETQYQSKMTDPSVRASIVGAEQAAREGNKIHQIETMEGPQFRTGSTIAPDLPQAQPQQPKQNFNRGNMRPPGKSTGFQTFPDDNASYDAMKHQLSLYGKRGINTLGGIISTWSPPSENDTQSLIKNASRLLGVDPNQPLDMSNPHVLNHIMTAIEKQEGSLKSVMSAPQGITPQQKSDIAVQQKQGELRAAEEENKRAEDLQLFSDDPQRLATYETMDRNSQEYLANLEKYKAQVGNNPLLSNNPVYNMRAALGTDPVIANIESQTQGFVQDQIKSMQAMGLSPTQMMNTETEAKRFMQSVAGNGNAEAKINAFNRYKAAKDADMQAYEESRKAAAARLGREYQPIVSQVKKPPTIEELLSKHGAK